MAGEAPTSSAVLLILDEQYLVAMQLAECAGQAGYGVLCPVATVEAAQALIDDSDIDAVLLDVPTSPDGRFIDLAVRLKAMGIPFAFLTDEPGEALPIAVEVPVLSKPFDSRRVVDVLGRLLAASEARLE